MSEIEGSTDSILTRRYSEFEDPKPNIQSESRVNNVPEFRVRIHDLPYFRALWPNVKL
jgi:hypothetical protein